MPKKKNKKKKVRISIGPKKPSEKTVFKQKVAELEKELDTVSKSLKTEEVSLELLKSKYSQEVESKKACVEHLKGVLQKATDDTMGVQNQYQWIRDLTELTEQRSSDLHRNLEYNQRLKKSLFQQQKGELEEKLARIEEVRTTRNSQLTKLKRLEKDLEEKTSTERKTKHRNNMAHVCQLLGKLKDFEHLVDSYSSVAKEAFELSLPVLAKRNLEDNIRLRDECEEASENLLAVQERSRQLKETQRILDLEIETQESADVRLTNVQSSLQSQHGRLLKENAQLQSVHSVGRENLKDIQSQIADNQREIARIIDKMANVEEILGDQNKYIDSLEEDVREKADMNGLRMSKILRAVQILKAKLVEVKEEKTCIDSNLLKQLSRLLDDD